MTVRCRGVPIDKEDWAGCHADNPKGTICPVCNNGSTAPVDGVMALAAKESVALAWAYGVPYERSSRIAAARVDAIKDMLHGKVLNIPWTAFDGFRRDDISSAMSEDGVSTEDLVAACISTITKHVDVKEAAIGVADGAGKLHFLSNPYSAGTITSVEMLKFIVLTVDRMSADLAADIKHAEESGSAK